MYSTSNIVVILKSWLESLKVLSNGTIRDRSHTSFYSSSTVTMAVSCTVFEIKRDTGRKERQFFIPLSTYLA